MTCLSLNSASYTIIGRHLDLVILDTSVATETIDEKGYSACVADVSGLDPGVATILG